MNIRRLPYALMIDPKAPDLELSRMAFKKINYELPVAAFTDVQGAIDFLMEMDDPTERPAILFLSNNGPYCDNQRLLKTIHEQGLVSFPVIVFVNNLSFEKNQWLELGATNVYKKPFDYFGNIRLFRKILMQHAHHLVPQFV